MPTVASGLARRAASAGASLFTSNPSNSGPSTDFVTTSAIAAVGTRRSRPNQRPIRLTESGTVTIETTAETVSRPERVRHIATGLGLLTGQDRGTCETASRMSAVSTEGRMLEQSWRSAPARNGMTTFMASSERSRSEGRRKRPVRSPGRARSATETTIRATLIWRASGMSWTSVKSGLRGDRLPVALHDHHRKRESRLVEGADVEVHADDRARSRSRAGSTRPRGSGTPETGSGRR